MRISELQQDINANGTFAGVRTSNRTNIELKKYQQENDIQNPNPMHKFHVTLLFSRKPCPNYEPLGEYPKPVLAEFKQWKIFPTQPDENGNISNCLVMALDCPWLIKRQKDLVREHGASFDFPEYVPHITLSYNAGDIDPESFPEFMEPIELVLEYQELINPKWAKGKE